MLDRRGKAVAAEAAANDDDDDGDDEKILIGQPSTRRRKIITCIFQEISSHVEHREQQLLLYLPLGWIVDHGV